MDHSRDPAHAAEFQNIKSYYLMQSASGNPAYSFINPSNVDVYANGTFNFTHLSIENLSN